ncbi:MAG: phage holin family protein [Candidatus Sungbacteria bacterium]|nr:phage holin family protein [bacterium]MDZ4260598.1 phage holin family protein [Candidatus Sungbacteria bacterium]
MKFLSKLLAKIVLNALAFYIAATYVTKGFTLSGGIEGLMIAAAVLALLHTFIRPLLKIVTAPLVWITFGLFNIVINGSILWIADRYLTQISFGDFYSLIVTALIITVANAFI